MEETSQHKSKLPQRKAKSKPKAEGSSHHGESSEDTASRRRSRSIDKDINHKPQSTRKEVEESLRRSRSSRKDGAWDKKTSSKDRTKATTPNVVALANAELNESLRRITPPNGTLSDDGLLEGSRSFHDDSHNFYGSHSEVPRSSLANLFKLDDSPKAIKTTKPLWMKGSMKWDTNANMPAPPPPESPQTNKARLMIRERKLERSSSHDGLLRADMGGDVVQKRRMKRFDKCTKASTQIQRIARGWLLRNRLDMTMKQGQKNKEHKNKKDKKTKQQNKDKERDRSLSPRRVGQQSPTEQTLTPLQSAMRMSLKRLGASQRDLEKNLSASQRDLLNSSFVRGAPDSSLDLYSSRHGKDDDDDGTELEQSLCSMFKSNIANVTARARRRSLRGDMSDSFSCVQGIL